MSGAATETNPKPKRKRVQVNVLDGRKANLIDFLRARSSRARNFLHKASTQEHVLYAAISELAEKKLQLELLQSKWDALRQRGTAVIHQQPQPKSVSALTDSEESSSLRSSGDFSPSNPSSYSEGLGGLSPLQLPTDPWDLPLFPAKSISDVPMDTDSYQSRSTHSPVHHAVPTTAPSNSSVTSVISPAAASRPIAPGRPQLIVPIYREVFHNSDVAMVVVSPSLKVLDFNESFLGGLPLLTYGPVSRGDLLSSGVTLIDFFSPTTELSGLFQKIAQVISTGLWQREGFVVSERPRLVLDATYFATYDKDASGTQRLRYITSLCRYHDFDRKPETVLALRKNRIGQLEPLPLPSPFAQRVPISDQIRQFVPS